MSAFDPGRNEYLEALEGRFRDALSSTLTAVFDADPILASEYLDDLLDAPPFQRALALHDDPLDVASALTGRPVTADRIAMYDAILQKSGEAESSIRDRPQVIYPDAVLSSSYRDERAPLVPLAILNKLMGELGYRRLTISSGTAYFLLERKAWKRPLPKRLEMETLPGLNADRDEVYGLDRVLNLLRGLQEFAHRRNPASTIASRIDRMTKRLLRTIIGTGFD